MAQDRLYPDANIGHMSTLRQLRGECFAPNIMKDIRPADGSLVSERHEELIAEVGLDVVVNSSLGRQAEAIFMRIEALAKEDVLLMQQAWI